MRLMSQAEAWKHLRVFHTDDAGQFAALDGKVPLLQELVIFHNSDYRIPTNTQRFNHAALSLLTIKAPALQRIALYGAHYHNMMEFLAGFAMTLVELKIV